MTKVWGVAFAALLALSALAGPASAITHQASVGNYWYEDDQQRDQTKIVVHQGDQITFTVREQAVPGHTVDVDALNIHSPNLNVGDTFTTPALRTPGNFYLYCRPHEQRGHHTLLVVVAAPRATPAATPKATQHSAGKPVPTAPTASASSPQAPAPTATLTPVGVGVAPSGAPNPPVPTNPNSLAALTGHRASGAPWTRSLWLLLIVAVPIVGAAVVALQRARIAQYQPTFENVRRARATSTAAKPTRRKTTTRKASPKRKR